MPEPFLVWLQTDVVAVGGSTCCISAGLAVRLWHELRVGTCRGFERFNMPLSICCLLTGMLSVWLFAGSNSSIGCCSGCISTFVVGSVQTATGVGSMNWCSCLPSACLDVV